MLLKGFMVYELYLNKDVSFKNAAAGVRAHQLLGPQSTPLLVAAGLWGAFSLLPHTMLYYKYIFGVDHHNSYLKYIKHRPEQGNGLNYFPRDFFFQAPVNAWPWISHRDRWVSMLLFRYCIHFDSERAKDISAENMKWFQIYFVTLTNTKSTMKQLVSSTADQNHTYANCHWGSYCHHPHSGQIKW